MQYLLTPEEYNELKSRAVPEEEFEKLRREVIDSSRKTLHSLLEIVRDSYHPISQSNVARMRAVFVEFDDVIKHLIYPKPTTQPSPSPQFTTTT